MENTVENTDRPVQPPPSRRAFLGAGLAVGLTAVTAGPALAGSSPAGTSPAGSSSAGSSPAGPHLTPVIGQVRRDRRFERVWDRFGDRSGALGWAGADGTYSAPLPDGRIAWLFNDTFLGPVSRYRGIRQIDPVHNTVVLGRPASGTPVRTLLRGTAAHPLPAAGEPGTATSWFWNGHGIVDGDCLRVIEFEQEKTGDDHFGFRWIGTSIASFSLPDLTLRDVREVSSANDVQWGVQFVRHRGHLYIYGVRGGGIGKQAHVARAVPGALLGRWEFWTGTDWSTDPGASVPIADNVGSSFGVTPVSGSWVLSTSDSFLGSDVYLQFADSPVGPFGGSTSIYTAPEGLPAADEDADGDIYGPYNIAAHPAVSRPGRLLLSYNVNSTAITDLWRDIGHNRARYLEVSIGA